MGTELIKIDGVLVEVKSTNKGLASDNSSASKKFEDKLKEIPKLLKAVALPIKNSIDELNTELKLDGAEIELGLSVGVKGNIYVSQGSVDANVKIKLILSPKT